MRTFSCLLVPLAVLALFGAGDSHAAEARNLYDRQPVALGTAPGVVTDEAPAPVEGKTPAHVVEKALPAAPNKATSGLWRAHIWESLPAENIGGTEPDAVSLAYQKNEWKPFFIDAQFALNESGKLLLKRLGGLESEAINPKPYRLEELSKKIDGLDQCRLVLRGVDPDFKDTNADQLSQPVTPDSRGSAASNSNGRSQAPSQSVDPAVRLKRYHEAFAAAADIDNRLASNFVLYAREMNPSSASDQVRALAGEISLTKFLADLKPSGSNYEALAAAYGRYRKLAAQGPQQKFAVSTKVRPGESGNHIRDLQKRLHQEGLYTGHITGVYDPETVRAVKEFQSAHLLEPDGVIGQGTRDWLNMPFQAKADLVAYSLKMLRQGQERGHQRYIKINIPQFQLEYYKDGKISETHRVIVGKSSGKKVKYRGKMIGENQTPTLSSEIEQVILNPRWYVSDRIRMELNAEAKSDPEYFTRHGYVQMASLHTWGEPRIFQRPGPKNALGRVKFEFPNVYAVYLHDTPKKGLFQRTRRDFSHGCIRVEKAVELAATLLKDDGSPYAQKMSTILNGDSQTFVKLSQPVPISIEYIPVVTNGSGHVVFVGDPYGILSESATQKG
ncbi:MAG: L,D-transpeptidase family protein [Desulfobacteraceae bacterium]|nr:L,D-transpeptidase family protein [Desulfobacteraceae bacterium]